MAKRRASRDRLDLCHVVRKPKAEVFASGNARRLEFEQGMHVVLVGDIVSGFECFGPFKTGCDAIVWKQQDGMRELTQGQWFLMPLREPTNGTPRPE